MVIKTASVFRAPTLCSFTSIRKCARRKEQREIQRRQCHVKLWHEWRNRLHVWGLGKGWWELAGWAVAQRKPQRTDQALGRFQAYLPDMLAVTKSLPG